MHSRHDFCRGQRFTGLKVNVSCKYYSQSADVLVWLTGTGTCCFLPVSYCKCVIRNATLPELFPLLFPHKLTN